MEKIWLIKIKNIIHGPLDMNEIRQMLLNKDLSLNDEISRSLSQWVYVKNCKELMDVHRELFGSSQGTKTTNIRRVSDNFSKKESNKNEDETTVDHSSEHDEDHSSVDKKSSYIEAELVEDASSDSLKTDNIDLECVQEADFDEKEEEKYSSRKSASGTASFESLDQTKKRARKKAHYVMNTLWGVIIGLTVVPFLYFTFPGLFSFNQALVSEDNETLLQARQAFRTGQYEQALSFFKQSPLKRVDDLISFSSLLIQLEDDTYNAKIELEKIKTKIEHDSELEKAILLDGLIQVKDENWINAEIIFDQAKTRMEDPSLALLNKAILKIQTNEKESALENLDLILQNALMDQSLRNSVLFLKALYQMENEDEQNISEVDFILNDLIDQKKDYAQESSLLLLYKNLKQDESSILDQIQNFLDEDPYLTFDHRYNILSYSPFLVWKEELMKYCSSIFERSPENSYFIAFYSFCLAQSGSFSSALENIEKAVNQSPRDSLIQAVYGFVLEKNDLNEKSVVPIESAIKYNQDNQFILPFILQARICEKRKDFECSKKYWEIVQSQRTKSLPAQAGISLALYHQGNKELSYQFFSRGVKLSPYYMPFLNMASLFE